MSDTHPTIACILIAQWKREALIDQYILPSMLKAEFDETLVVGDYKPSAGYRYLEFPPVTATTMDALWKRDIGAEATTSDVLVYLSDDHCLGPGFGTVLRQSVLTRGWDALVPQRRTHQGVYGKSIPLNMGLTEQYCAGHAGIFRRYVLQRCPWGATPHTLVWDLGHSRWMQAEGFRLVGAPQDLMVEDVEGSEPWK